MLPAAAKPPNKFFVSGDSDDEKEEISKKDSPVSSPATQVCAVVARLDFSLTPGSQASLKQSLEKVKAKPDKERGFSFKKIGEAINHILFGDPKVKKVNTPQLQTAHERIKENPELHKMMQTVQKLEKANQFKASPCLSTMNVIFYNWEHIFAGDKKGGLHYGSPKNFKQVEPSSLSDEVFGGTAKKFSSVFNADLISRNALKQRLMDPNRVMIASQDNRRLFLNHGSRFLIESYEQGKLGSSAFPIFFHAIFDDKQKYQITRTQSIDSDTVLKAAINLIHEAKFGFKQGIKYYIPNWQEDVSCFVVDIAPAIKTSIKSGIYFFIPTHFFAKAKEIEPFLKYYSESE